jgi:hypothetical protein
VLAGAFRTGSARDAAPPTWDGLKKGVADDPGWPHKLLSLGGSCGEGLSAYLFGDPAKDEGPVLYAVWVGSRAGPIDYTAPPAAYLSAGSWGPEAALLGLGQLGCWPTEIPLPKNVPSVRLGAAAVDLAGKRSATSELTLSLRPPARPR